MNHRMRYLEETPMLDFSDPSIQALIEKHGWRELNGFERLRSIYDFVRDDVLFGYNVDDAISASQVLADGFGQCNTKATLFMALLRACGISCRIHGFTIDKTLQRGAMTGLVYLLAPKDVLHSWVEVSFEGRWYELEGLILDTGYLTAVQAANPECAGAFCGAVSDIRNPIVNFDRNDTYVQSERINRDFGVYDSPDDLLAEHRQQMSAIKAFVYRHLGRRLMNANVARMRRSAPSGAQVA